MIYLLIESGYIQNVISADEEAAVKLNAKPFYFGAKIGALYAPPAPDPTPDEDRDAMLIDLEYRLTLIELGVI